MESEEGVAADATLNEPPGADDTNRAQATPECTNVSPGDEAKRDRLSQKIEKLTYELTSASVRHRQLKEKLEGLQKVAADQPFGFAIGKTLQQK
eukprot:4875510-Pleurochrysis_carterae.AAC.9